MEIVIDMDIWQKFCNEVKPADPITELRKIYMEALERLKREEENK